MVVRFHLNIQLLLFGCLACLLVTAVVNADGRVFVLDLRNSSGQQGFRDAEQACASHHARLASAEELHHAVVECFFSSCTRGWLYGGSVGTTVCNIVGSTLKAVDMRIENATVDTAHLDAFCVKDRGVPCGDPPSFPNAHLQEHSGFEMGDELLYTCVPGYVMPSGHTAFSLLCDSCGEWYGLVQICVKGETESHVDYEDKFTDTYGDTEHHNEGPQEAHGKVHEEVYGAAYPEGKRSQEQQETSFTVTIENEHQDQHGEHDVEGKYEGDAEDGEQNKERAVEDFIGHLSWEQERSEEVRTDAATATEAPVSLLSQKHMFWFPSEAFQEEGLPVSTNPVTQPTQRASGAQSEESKEHESQESPHQHPVKDDHQDPVQRSYDDHEDSRHDDHNDHDDHDDEHYDDPNDGDSHQDEDHDDVKHPGPHDGQDRRDRYEDHDDHNDHYDMGEHEEEHHHVRHGSQGYDDTYDEHESYEDHDDETDDHVDEHPHVSEEHPDLDDHDDREEPYDQDEDDRNHYTDHDDHDDHGNHDDHDDHGDLDDHDDHHDDDHRDDDNYDDHDSHEDDDGRRGVIISTATNERQNITQRRAGGKATTDETWLDGYPVVLENGDTTTEQVSKEDRERGTVVKTTDRPNEVDVHRPVPYTSLPEDHDAPTTVPEDQAGVEEVWPGLIQTLAPSPDQLQPSDTPSYFDTLDYDTQQAAPTHSWQGDLTDPPFLDHGPAPPVHDGDKFTGVLEEHTVHDLPGETGERGKVEGEMGEAICVGEDCPPHPPSSSSRGPTVAAIIVAVCAIATAIIVGVWCYRRQQQKSSVYEMNGKGQSQTRQGQQIEMQQKV